MDRPDEMRREERERLVQRVSADVADRLRDRGVTILPSDTPEDIAILLDAVEAFERAVQEQGGDLMLVEPVSGYATDPDTSPFVLPQRAGREPVPDYLARLQIATRSVQRYRHDR
ncbi:MAG TPA: hypothetical protein VLE53_16025 [Gemmatimonadaceae bacterium]|nr:hypothetical protein [Gemmatimonadaceae bacterium]